MVGFVYVYLLGTVVPLTYTKLIISLLRPPPSTAHSPLSFSVHPQLKVFRAGCLSFSLVTWVHSSILWMT